MFAADRDQSCASNQMRDSALDAACIVGQGYSFESFGIASASNRFSERRFQLPSGYLVALSGRALIFAPQLSRVTDAGSGGWL
jgi:hypothetical protein